MFILYRG